MQQTLLAVVGLMTVTLLSLNQHRSAIETRRAMLDDEMEVMASGLALQAMEYIGTKSFDEATKDHEGTASNPGRFSRIGDSADNLSAIIPEDRTCTLLPAREGTGSYEACDDISDFNEMEWERMPFAMGVDTVHFEVTARVRYITEQREVLSSGTSKNKEVIVIVRQAGKDGVRKLLRQPISITRTFSLP